VHCTLEEDIQNAQEKLAVLEEEKSKYAAIILNVTTQDINVKIRALFAEITNNMRTLQVSIFPNNVKINLLKRVIYFS